MWPIAWLWCAMLGIVPGPGLLFGLMLVAAIVGGYAARSIHLPRVVGFLVGGMVLRAILHALVAPDPAGAERAALEASGTPLAAIKDLALGIILFTLGGVFERSRLRAVVGPMTKVGGLEITFSALFVFSGCVLVGWLTSATMPFSQYLVLALLLGTSAIATAPAATIMVLQEYDAKGPITDVILGLTGVNNIVCIVLFYTTFLMLASFGLIQTKGTLGDSVGAALLATLAGSLVLGIGCGTLISMIHGRFPLPETLLIFFGMLIVLGAGEDWLLEHNKLSFNFLLTALVAGGVFANIAIDSAKLISSLRTVGFPIFAAFFVMAGYDLHLAEFARMGWIGAAYVLCRFAGKLVGAYLGVRWAGAPQRVGARMGTTLLCQAAVVIGLVSFVTQNLQNELARQFETVILGSVVVFELLGPVLLKRCVMLGGEVKAITLLRRAGSATEGGSIVWLTLKSLFRLFGIHSRTGPIEGETLQVQHIMRSNIQFIPASASLDEVLHFIERSTYNHFPVVHEEGQLAGVIHFSDVRDVIYDPSMSALVTGVDLADPDSAVVPMDMTLDKLLDLFTKENVGVLPVTEQEGSRRLVGVVEQRDLLTALHLSNKPAANQ